VTKTGNKTGDRQWRNETAEAPGDQDHVTAEETATETNQTNPQEPRKVPEKVVADSDMH